MKQTRVRKFGTPPIPDEYTVQRSTRVPKVPREKALDTFRRACARLDKRGETFGLTEDDRKQLVREFWQL